MDQQTAPEPEHALADGAPLRQAQALTEQAARLIAGGQVEPGMEKMEQAIGLVADRPADVRAFFVARKAVLLIRADRSDEGLRTMDEAMALAQDTDQAELVEEIRSRRGLALVELGRVNEGLGELKAALAEAENRKDPVQACRVLGLLGDAYRMAADESNSEASYLRAIGLAESMDPPMATTGIRLGLGQARLAAGRPAAVVEALEPALEFARESGDAARQRSLLATLAEAYLQLDRRQELLTTTKRLLEMAEAAKDHRDAITQRENVITVLFSLDRPQEALPHIEEALAYARRRGPQERKLVHLINLGRAQFELANLAEAEEAYNEALDLAEDQENVKAVPTILGRLGALYAESGDLEAALRFGELAAAKAADLGDSAIVAEQSILLAMTYRDVNREPEARQAAERARAAYEKQGNQALAEQAVAFMKEADTA
jgi:tetratricopeptide (TPR) repeat protein